MHLANLHLLRPWWLLALIPLAWIIARWWRNEYYYSVWQGVCEPHLLPHVLAQGPSAHRYLVAAFACAWFGIVLALCGPAWEHTQQAIYKAQQAQVIALDMSDNMAAEDIKPNRLARARFKALDLLHQSKEIQTGLIVFSSEPFVVSPITQDAETIAAMVPILRSDILPVTGQNIGAAIEKAAALFQQAGIPQGRIIVVTASSPTAADIAAAEKIFKQGYRLSILGIGTALGAPIPGGGDTPILAKLDKPGLEKLAQAGGGQYYAFTPSDADVAELLQTQNNNKIKVEKTAETAEQWLDQGYWLLLPVLLLAAFMFRRGWFEELTR